MEWKLIKVSIFGMDGEFTEGYTNDTEWDGSLNVAFTGEQISKWLDLFSYDYRFIKNEYGKTNLIIYFENEETIESSPLYINEEFIEVYFVDRYNWIEVKEE